MTIAQAQIKTTAEDFFVAEILGFTPDNTGEHLWLYIEKSGMNTAYLKRRIAQQTGIAIKDIAHSGLKDRHAITRQWLSLPAKQATNLPDGEQNPNECWKILERHHHSKKLRIGTHKQNAFTITLREINGHRREIDDALAKIQEHGAPNNFGMQRFGQKNREEALHYVAKNQLPRKADIRSRVLSTLRAEAFNRQLEMRLKDGSAATPLLGDRAILAHSNSHFRVEEITAELINRAATGDISPAGWLPGKGLRPEKEAAIQCDAALLSFRDAVEYLIQHTDSGWRPFIMHPEAMNWHWSEDDKTLTISFILPSGSYATTLLASIFELHEPMKNPPAT